VIWPNGMAQADMAEPVHHALIEQMWFASTTSRIADETASEHYRTLWTAIPVDDGALAPDSMAPYYASQDSAINLRQAA